MHPLGLEYLKLITFSVFVHTCSVNALHTECDSIVMVPALLHLIHIAEYALDMFSLLGCGYPPHSVL